MSLKLLLNDYRIKFLFLIKKHLMKTLFYKLSCLLAIALLTHISYASKSLPINHTILHQQVAKDTTSYWFVTNGYYITFTKDSVPGQWVYKSFKPATDVKTPDPSKKVSATILSSPSMMLKISLGNKIFMFKNTQSTNTLRYITSISNTPPPSSNTPPSSSPAPKQ